MGRAGAPTAGAGGRAPGPLDAPLALAPDARRPASSSLLRLSVSARMRMLVLSVVMYWCAGGAELWSHTYRRNLHADPSWLSAAGRWREGDEGDRGGSEGMGELGDDKGSSPRHLRMNLPEDGRFSSASMLGALWRVRAREPHKFKSSPGAKRLTASAKSSRGEDSSVTLASGGTSDARDAMSVDARVRTMVRGLKTLLGPDGYAAFRATGRAYQLDDVDADAYYRYLHDVLGTSHPGLLREVLATLPDERKRSALDALHASASASVASANRGGEGASPPPLRPPSRF